LNGKGALSFPLLLFVLRPDLTPPLPRGFFVWSFLLSLLSVPHGRLPPQALSPLSPLLPYPTTGFAGMPVSSFLPSFLLAHFLCDFFVLRDPSIFRRLGRSLASPLESCSRSHAIAPVSPTFPSVIGGLESNGGYVEGDPFDFPFSSEHPHCAFYFAVVFPPLSFSFLWVAASTL